MINIKNNYHFKEYNNLKNWKECKEKDYNSKNSKKKKGNNQKIRIKIFKKLINERT